MIPATHTLLIGLHLIGPFECESLSPDRHCLAAESVGSCLPRGSRAHIDTGTGHAKSVM